MKKIGVGLISFFFGVNVVFASACDNNDIFRLKTLSQNVNYDASYIGDNDGINDYQLYSVKFSGLNNEIYISDNRYSFFVNNDGDSINLKSGINNLEIYSKNCGDLRLRTLTINLPRFNTYSLSDAWYSIDINEFELCDPWYQGKIDSNYFSEKLDKYLEEKNEKKKDNSNRGIYDYFVNNYYLFVAFSILILFLVVVLVKRNNKRNKLD